MSRSYLTDRERARKLAQEIAPSRVDAYFDKVQIWLKEKLPRSQQPEWLQKARRTHRAHKHDGAMRYHGDYVQRWQLRQPTRDELQWMSRLDGVLLNGVEVSLDWVLRYMDERDAAFGWLCRCHVMPGQRGDQQIRWVKGRVRYSGPQGAPNVLAMYADRRSRISGERFCVHLDWRINGVEALQRAGIRSVQDLLNFSHYGFWKKRLRCYEVDTKKLGRVYHERVLGKGRRRQWISRTNGVTYDYDSRAGYAIFRVNGRVRFRSLWTCIMTSSTSWTVCKR